MRAVHVGDDEVDDLPVVVRDRADEQERVERRVDHRGEARAQERRVVVVRVRAVVPVPVLVHGDIIPIGGPGRR